MDRATSIPSAVLFDPSRKFCGLPSFLLALTPGADEFQPHKHPSSSCWRKEHRDQGRVSAVNFSYHGMILA